MKTISLFLTICYLLCAPTSGKSQNDMFPYSKLSFIEVDMSSVAFIHLAGMLKSQSELIKTNERFSAGDKLSKDSNISNMETRLIKDDPVNNASSVPFSLLAGKLLESNTRQNSNDLIRKIQNQRLNAFVSIPIQESRKSIMYLEPSAEWIELQAPGWLYAGKQRPTLISAMGDWKFKVGAW